MVLARPFRSIFPVSGTVAVRGALLTLLFVAGCDSGSNNGEPAAAGAAAVAGGGAAGLGTSGSSPLEGTAGSNVGGNAGGGGSSGGSAAGSNAGGMPGGAGAGAGGLAGFAGTASGNAGTASGGSAGTGGAGGGPGGIDKPGYKLLWSDEFDVDGPPNPDNWKIIEWPPGTVNMELEAYTSDSKNVRVEGGNLVIEVRKDNGKYTSGRIEGRMKRDFKYGLVEMRVQLTKGAGTWPAIWMMPTDEVYGPWPDSGEVDVLEYIGRDAENPKSFLHTKGYNFKIGNNPHGQLNIPTADSAFHIYGVNWTPTKMVPFAEDHEMFTWTKTAEGPAQWPFDQNFYLIVNVALGGGYGGAVDDNALPARLLVDYIRVYQPL